MWTGLGTNRGWILANSQSPSTSGTFASSYAPASVWDSCNGIAGSTGRVTLAACTGSIWDSTLQKCVDINACLGHTNCARDGDVNSVCLDTPAPGVGHTCVCSANFTLIVGASVSLCQGSTLFIGRVGNVNTVGHFETTSLGMSATSFIARGAKLTLTSIITATVFSGHCPSRASISFPVTTALLAYLREGVQGGWLPISATVTSGTVTYLPTHLW